MGNNSITAGLNNFVLNFLNSTLDLFYDEVRHRKHTVQSCLKLQDTAQTMQGVKRDGESPKVLEQDDDDMENGTLNSLPSSKSLWSAQSAYR